MKKILLFSIIFLASLPLYSYEPAVVSADAAATKVGRDILDEGGNAADAIVATAFALGVVEPHNSGLGGGGFLLYYSAKKNQFYFVDYRESSSHAANADFYKKNSDLLREGPFSVGVPGFVRGMEVIHQAFGQTDWKNLVEPARLLAEEGFGVNGLLDEKIKLNEEMIKKDAGMSEVFLDNSKIVQKDLAVSLGEIKEKGAKAFYEGSIGQKILKFYHDQKQFINSADLKYYSVYFRKPVKFEHGRYQVVSAPLPSSGGSAIELMFKKAIIYGLAKHRPGTPEAALILANIFNDYFEYRSMAYGDVQYNIVSHTTHLCAIDSEGNIAAMTNTLNSPFGSGVMVPGTGIILNNELNDFSLDASSPNRIAPHRRPLSSMAPTIVFKNNKPVLAIGTPGGLSIPQNLFQILFAMWDMKLTLPNAVRIPKIVNVPENDQPKMVYEKSVSGKVVQALESQYSVEEKDRIGNVQALIIENEKSTSTYSDLRGNGKGMTGKSKVN